jgi:hypothetical protein
MGDGGAGGSAGALGTGACAIEGAFFQVRNDWGALQPTTTSSKADSKRGKIVFPTCLRISDPHCEAR